MAIIRIYEYLIKYNTGDTLPTGPTVLLNTNAINVDTGEKFHWDETTWVAGWLSFSEYLPLDGTGEVRDQVRVVSDTNSIELSVNDSMSGLMAPDDHFFLSYSEGDKELRTSALDTFRIGSDTTFLTPVIGVDPTEDLHLVTKQYLDSSQGTQDVAIGLNTTHSNLTSGNPHGVTYAELGGTQPDPIGGPYLPLTGGTMGMQADIVLKEGDLRLSAAEHDNGPGSGSKLIFESSGVSRGELGFTTASSGPGAYPTHFFFTELVSGITPISPEHLVTKEYVDDLIVGIPTGDYLPLAGGSMDKLAVVDITNPSISSTKISRSFVIVEDLTNGRKATVGTGIFRAENTTTNAKATLYDNNLYIQSTSTSQGVSYRIDKIQDDASVKAIIEWKSSTREVGINGPFTDGKALTVTGESKFTEAITVEVAGSHAIYGENSIYTNVNRNIFNWNNNGQLGIGGLADINYSLYLYGSVRTERAIISPEPTAASHLTTKKYVDENSGAKTFVALTDTPADALSSYPGQRVSVNAAGTGLEYTEPSGTGLLSTKYRFSTILTGLPAAGYCSVNNATILSVTEISLNILDNSDLDISGTLGSISKRDIIAFDDRNTSDTYTFRVEGAGVLVGDVYTFPVSVTSVKGVLNNNERITAELIHVGAKKIVDLLDTPDIYGAIGQVLAVNNTGLSMEWVTPSGGGGAYLPLAGGTLTGGLTLSYTDAMLTLEAPTNTGYSLAVSGSTEIFLWDKLNSKSVFSYRNTTQEFKMLVPLTAPEVAVPVEGAESDAGAFSASFYGLTNAPTHTKYLLRGYGTDIEDKVTSAWIGVTTNESWVGTAIVNTPVLGLAQDNKHNIVLSSCKATEGASQINSRLQIGFDQYTPDQSKSETLAVNGNVSASEPTADNHLATKLYVDSQSSGGGAFLPLAGGHMDEGSEINFLDSFVAKVDAYGFEWDNPGYRTLIRGTGISTGTSGVDAIRWTNGGQVGIGGTAGAGYGLKVHGTVLVTENINLGQNTELGNWVASSYYAQFHNKNANVDWTGFMQNETGSVDIHGPDISMKGKTTLWHDATFKGKATGIAPTEDLHLATKKYVDDNVSGENLLSGSGHFNSSDTFSMYGSWVSGITMSKETIDGIPMAVFTGIPSDVNVVTHQVRVTAYGNTSSYPGVAIVMKQFGGVIRIAVRNVLDNTWMTDSYLAFNITVEKINKSAT